MNLRLRARLIISYLVVIAVMLAVMSVALFLFLLAEPARPEPTYQKLAAISRDMITQYRDTLFSRPPLTALTALPDELSTFAQENDVRIMILNVPSRTILYDSAGEFQRGDTLQYRPDTYTLPQYLRGNIPNAPEPLIGNFQDSEGESWLFTGLASIRRGSETNAIILADHAPVRSVDSVWQEFRDGLAPPLIQAAGVGILIALVLAVFISRNIALSLQSLAEAAREVAKGNYAWRVPVTGSPEVRSVAEAFNRMSGEVHSTQQAQQDFLANVSHDLKTPLTSIQGYSQAIMDGTAKDPADAGRIIHEESARLNRMVIELTDLARLQAGQLSMQSVPIDMGALTDAIGQRLSVVAQKRGVTLHLQTTPTPEIAGDGDRLAQVLTNLVGNAINYTPSGGQVWLRTGVNNGGVEVVVQDTGVGISPDELPRIFERFYQVDKARGPKRGTGLGLAITQEIVVAHGGRIAATSAGKGKGSTFTIWLPSNQVKTAGRQ